ncbi:hypothetical protein CPB83DRAFT_774264, partial [Crepidotus variabilis]
FERFRCLLEAPYLASHVRDLEISCRMNSEIFGEFMLLRHLNSVQTFTFGFSNGNRNASSPRSWSTVPDEAKDLVISFIQQNHLSSLSLFCIKRLPVNFLLEMHQLKNLTVFSVNSLSSTLSAIKRPIRLERLKLLRHSIGFTNNLILGPFAIFDISTVTELRIDSGWSDDTPIFTQVLRLPTHLEFLDLSLADSMYFGAWNGNGNILSVLQPSALATLKSIKLKLSVQAAISFQPFGGFIDELERISKMNNLEEIAIDIQVEFDSSLDMDPTKWNRLDEVLSTGFPRLRKLSISTCVAIYFSVSPWEDAARIQGELEELFAENFHWARANLTFTASAEGVVI